MHFGRTDGRTASEANMVGEKDCGSQTRGEQRRGGGQCDGGGEQRRGEEGRGREPTNAINILARSAPTTVTLMCLRPSEEGEGGGR